MENNKITVMMAWLDTVYGVFIEHNSNPADTIKHFNDTYGYSTESIKDVLTVAIQKANKDAKGESCLAEVQALIEKHLPKPKKEADNG